MSKIMIEGINYTLGTHEIMARNHCNLAETIEGGNVRLRFASRYKPWRYALQ